MSDERDETPTAEIEVGRRIPGRAHTNEEKRELLAKLLTAWQSPKARHLRLGQLIANAGIAETFYVEDSELLDLVERYAASR